ncbi:hypothetical protein [Streptomyces flavofungini]|uniref:DUF2256 domain-containing protein n=1 Tax=Streptomyces flavofungini TaxID=68200 RepID=A0ABS0X2D1_9ACTN|nr:hypothetical protein [Streptomyces flavofungini]MBJ3807341.1 hypothetical protein [Streptomyces flavofungini]
MNGGTRIRTLPCGWCHVPVPQPRSRWRTRRYCSKAHRRKNRVVEAVGNFLDSV